MTSTSTATAGTWMIYEPIGRSARRILAGHFRTRVDAERFAEKLGSGLRVGPE